ncbi:Transcription repressor [Nymphaea thermarum]|nr:Transcription repressor [Nymphaea thermarum]
MSTRRNPLRHPAVVSIGCNCRRPRIAGLPVKKPKPKPKPKPPPAAGKKGTSPPPRPSTSSCSWERFFSGDDLSTSTAFSSSKASRSSPDRGRGLIPPALGGSVAVVKTSDDPYHDFRNSMVQMIVENEIYSRDDLCELLRCLLSLNSPFHHDAILRAFAEIVDGFFP